MSGSSTWIVDLRVRKPERTQKVVAYEETGLQGLRIVQYLGVGEYDIRPYADAIHARHYFQLTTDSSDLPERWEAYEDNDGVSERIRFELYWIPLEKAHVLGAGQGAFIGRVVDDSGSK